MRALYDVAAPAKLNLFLHVTGRRPDGYHSLQSAMVLIDWCDTLHFELRSDGQISRTDIGQALPADDLILRAARALQADSGCPHGAQITVEKHLPVQAGLGGGSSDAASCLLALNRLWGLGYGLARLHALGLRLGADVPFFLHGQNAWAEGIGERLTVLGVPPRQFLVVKPQQGMDTALVFADPQLNRNSETAIISGFAADPFAFGRNDLQPVAQRLCPEVEQALKWLAIHGLSGRMSGSGTAVFALLAPTTADLAQMKAQASSWGWTLRECSSLEAHPLLGWADCDDSSVGG